MSLPAVSFEHLRRLTDATGLFEHASGTVARKNGGYCVDDVARALVVVSRQSDSELSQLTEVYLAFLLSAQGRDGRFRNRLGPHRRWMDSPSVEDCWGRALWGLGAAIAAHPPAGPGDAALDAFTRGAAWRSPWRHAMAFAALGAAEVLTVLPEHAAARAMLAAAAERIGRPRASRSWPWPEDTLRYASAALPEALLAAGVALDDESLRADGLLLLDWLLTAETRDGHLSVTPVGGRGPGASAAAFDQQPIEAAAIAGACARAYAITGERRFADGVELAAGWFLGANDSGIPLYDPVTGGCCDGLQRVGRNENQGAESTLAALSTLQLATLQLASLQLTSLQLARRIPVLSR